MSITGISDQEKKYKKSFHRRNDSGELDVFEAARYFSCANDISGYNSVALSHKLATEDGQARRVGRISLDLPLRNSISSQTYVMEKQRKEKKHNKQPSSPGGKIASFLNALFSQASSKKKKSKSATQSMKDDDHERHGDRRKRRSSISHLQSTRTGESKFTFSSSSSGFRTPPPFVNTHAKVYKDLRSYSDNKEVLPSSKQNEDGNMKSSSFQREVYDDKRNSDYAWIDEKFKSINGISEKYKNCGNVFLEKGMICTDQYLSEGKEFKKFNEVDDGADSDSSSDLFELQNYDLGYYPSGLPVYETTHMDNLKRGAPISNGVI